ncbi:hypothetical protein KOI35_30435 [Actinoplanes bogorensis]|uniref:Uncharacterized protein n=1 Tax=Paractinoplanes bogorensis TaxID=1610840 RepID=A0ABS5YWT8_9ACTN|nr:hypothetical protein [Actinoplanes bogorensis]MBU2667838.1 hypothetical protein [Actinoplanes bogorensis]
MGGEMLSAAQTADNRIMGILAVVLVAVIVGGGTGILARVDAMPLGGSILRGGSAFAVVLGLASAHAGLHAPLMICVVNALLGVLSGLCGLILKRMDSAPWCSAVLGGGACFGGAVGMAVAVEVLAGAL